MQYLTKHFESLDRYYEVAVTRDLIGWVVERRWGGGYSRLGDARTEPVEHFTAGCGRAARIHRPRTQRAYRCVVLGGGDDCWHEPLRRHYQPTAQAARRLLNITRAVARNALSRGTIPICPRRRFCCAGACCNTLAASPTTGVVYYVSRESPMGNTVFFSWQSDTDPDCGKFFIERCLKDVIRQLSNHPELQEATRDEDITLDKDTQGAAGQVPIVDTILTKIETAGIFVPDFTYVSERANGHGQPNANVLIEYGYALSKVGLGRIVAVMNTAHFDAAPEKLPFDLRHLRKPISYCLPDGASKVERDQVQKQLVPQLFDAIKRIFTGNEYLKSLPQPEPFSAKQPQQGKARFRLDTELLGQRDEPLHNSVKVQFQPGAAQWLRVMPTAPIPRNLTERQLIELRDMDPAALSCILAPWAGSVKKIRAADGVGYYNFMSKHEFEEDLEFADSVAMVFKSGEIWSIDTVLLQQASTANVINIDERRLAVMLRRYSNFLIKLGIKPPFHWIAGVEGVKNRVLYNDEFNWMPSSPCLQSVIEIEGEYSPSESAGEALRPFFNAIYDACGVERRANQPVHDGSE